MEDFLGHHQGIIKEKGVQQKHRDEKCMCQTEMKVQICFEKERSGKQE